MSTHVASDEPIDFARATWSPVIDWVLVGTLLLSVVGAVAVLTGRFFGVIPVLAAIYGVSCWRAARMNAALPDLEAAADEGHLRAVVNVGKGSLFQWIGSGTASVLTVDRGWVSLEGSAPQRWPVGAVSLGSRPSWWSGRGIELRTPDGSRYVSFVRPGDPGFYGRPIVDRKAMQALARALSWQQAAQAAAVATTPPGWYPDPAGRRMLRWWDGTAWSAETRYEW